MKMLIWNGGGGVWTVKSKKHAGDFSVLLAATPKDGVDVA